MLKVQMDKYRFVCIMGLLFILLSSCQVSLFALTNNPQHQKMNSESHQSFDVIMVGNEDPWLLMTATALTAQLSTKKHRSLILMKPHDATNEEWTQWVITNLSRRVIKLDIQNKDTISFVSANTKRSIQIAGTSLYDTSLLIAKSFWQQSDQIIVCRHDQVEAGLHGALLAAHSKVPFIVYQAGDDFQSLNALINKLKVKQIQVCSNDASQNRSELFNVPIEYLNPDSIRNRLVTAIGIDRIRNVVLVRTPGSDSWLEWDSSAWLGPYLSYMRNSLFITTSNGNVQSIEHSLSVFLKQHALKPQTITLLADYDSIATIPSEDNRLQGYDVRIEPFSMSTTQGIASLGIGRIPCRQLYQAASLITRGLIYDTLLVNKQRPILMVANPNRGSGNLPLAETVSRLTAAEFKNVGLPILEFYGQSTENNDVRTVAGKACMIIYEGHVTDQTLFQDVMEYSYVIGEDNDYDNHFSPMADIPDYPEDILPLTPQVPQNAARPVVDRLEGHPLVILQSCNSLDEYESERIFQRGGIGLVGSVSNIHSASGSSFIKAFCDNLIYRNMTLGEALRDARNYFICLSSLKENRGHVEMAKVYRVAYSFHLWGDPELRPFPFFLPPQHAPIKANFSNPKQFAITTPQQRLPDIQTEKYTVKTFPGSQVAGIVKRMKNKEARRLMPLYFIRLPRPSGFVNSETDFYLIDEPTDRALLFTDSYDRFVYLLYFPEKILSNHTAYISFVQ